MSNETERDTSLVLRRHGRLAPPVEGDVLVSADLGPQGTMVALWARPEDREALFGRTRDSGGASFPDPRTARPVEVRVAEYAPRMQRVVTLRELRIGFPSVQPLPDGRLLVVGARCRRRGGDPEHNAAVHDPDGTPVRTGVLGDGIEHVRTTTAGDVWVGYFDEGVFGNLGWDDPIGAPGLVRFDADLRQTWRYEPPEEAGFIADCYALNVTDTETWTCYYNAFPVVRIRDGRAEAWPAGVPAQALAVHGDRVALVGGYDTDHNRVVFLERSAGKAATTGTGRVRLPDGSPAPAQTRFTGHGAELHALCGTDWYRADLETR